MNFNNFSNAVKAKDSSAKLSSGIHNATFQGVDKTVIKLHNGDESNALSLKLNIEGYGDWTTNFFEPISNERKESQYGLMASQEDHFMITLRQILSAVNPDFIKDIESGDLVIGGSFTNVVNALKVYTDKFIGKATQIKLVPNNKGYVGVPSYPAMITKNGELAMATRFIGDNLTLNAKEERLIKAAAVAKPTVMEKPAIDLSDISASLDITGDLPDGDDGLPF